MPDNTNELIILLVSTKCDLSQSIHDAGLLSKSEKASRTVQNLYSKTSGLRANPGESTCK